MSKWTPIYCAHCGEFASGICCKEESIVCCEDCWYGHCKSSLAEHHRKHPNFHRLLDEIGKLMMPR